MLLNKYAKLDHMKLDNHLSDYILDRFSYSSLSSFCRNQINFYKEYIEKERDFRSSPSALIGRAYHKALENHFNEKEGLDYDDLCSNAIDYIDQTPIQEIKLGKTYEEKGIEKLKSDAYKKLGDLLQNFQEDKQFFDDNVEWIVGTEFGIDSFPRLRTINYDIPLPIKSFIDLLFVNKQGELCFMDFKTTSKLSSDADAKIKYMMQCTLYAAAIDGLIAMHTEGVIQDDFIAELLKRYPKAKEGAKFGYFYENKASKNRDKSPQTRMHKTDITAMRPLYEAMLYDQLIGFFYALKNPEHIYTINLNDNFADTGEILDFWIRKYVEKNEENFSENSALQKMTKSVASIGSDILNKIKKDSNYLTSLDMANKTPQEKIEIKLKILGLPVKIADVIDSYSCTTYLLTPIGTTSASAINKKGLDIAHALGQEFVRISEKLVRIGDDSFISIEVNKNKEDRTYPENTPKSSGIALGVDTMNNDISWMIEDHSTPHLMIAGATGSGKSVAIRSIINQCISKRYKVDIIDPKYEFDGYDNVTQESDSIILKLNELVEEMDNLYKTKKRVNKVLIFDEASDVLTRTKMLKSDTTLKTPKDCVLLLAQKGRSCGIHIVMASQRITAKLFDGDTRAQFPARLCLTTASAIDSKVMLEQDGAEYLGGYGDSLYTDPNYKSPIRIQCFS